MHIISYIKEHHEEAGEMPSPPMKLLLSVDEAARALGVRRTFFYTKLLQTGEVFSLKLEGRRLVPVHELQAYVERLTNAQKAS